VADEGLLVEPAYLCPADPSGQDRDMIEVRVAGHGRHRGVQVAGGELCRQVVIEHIRQPTVARCTRHGRPPIPRAGRDLPWHAPAGGRRSRDCGVHLRPEGIDSGGRGGSGRHDGGPHAGDQIRQEQLSPTLPMGFPGRVLPHIIQPPHRQQRAKTRADRGVTTMEATLATGTGGPRYPPSSDDR